MNQNIYELERAFSEQQVEEVERTFVVDDLGKISKQTGSRC